MDVSLWMKHQMLCRTEQNSLPQSVFKTHGAFTQRQKMSLFISVSTSSQA